MEARPPETSLREEHDPSRDPAEHEPSCVSLKSDMSKDHFYDFKGKEKINERVDAAEREPSCLSCRSAQSMDAGLQFKEKCLSRIGLKETVEAAEHQPSCLSCRSAASKDAGLQFKGQCSSGMGIIKRPDSAQPELRCRRAQLLGSHQGVKGQCRPRTGLKRRPVPARPEPSCLSLKSNQSKEHFYDFRQQCSPNKNISKRSNRRPDSAKLEPSCVSLKSDKSKEHFQDFRRRYLTNQYTRIKSENLNKRLDSAKLEPSCLSLKSDKSKEHFQDFRRRCLTNRKKIKSDNQQSSEILSGQSAQHHQKDLDSIFEHLEESIVDYVKNELEKIRRLLNSDSRKQMKNLVEDEKELNDEEAEQLKSCKEGFLKMVVGFLRRMKQEDLADCLQSSNVVPVHQHKLKCSLKKKFQCVFEGIAKAGTQTLLNEIYTELYITEGGTGEVNAEHEVKWIENASRKPDRPETTIRQEDIFKAVARSDRPIRTVMTKGVAGIGKTVLTQKFTLDWAEDKANKEIQFTFPFTFRELNVMREKKLSLVELIHHFFGETKDAGICRFEDFHVMFIFDGLDECRLPLDFHTNEKLADATRPASVDVLLTNLIKGELLPRASLWITTRPAAANQIPPECVDMVTEVRGFTDPQKEEYFRKRFKDKEQAKKIISHIKTSRSLHIMCHIPVFCWITATVLEDVLKTKEGGELPKTLTEMYIHFLVVQSKRRNIKYNGGAEIDPHWNPESRKMIESLGRLAFEQLQKGNLIFYESDLTECSIDIKEASVYSGVFTQVFKEEQGLYQEKVFCFIHLSVQEFLAAVHARLTFTNSGVNLMADEPSTSQSSETGSDVTVEAQFYQTVVDKALQSPNGHLDLFLRFLLGLSLKTNQNLLRGLVRQTESSSQTNQDTIAYIKEKIEEIVSIEKSINLFHCLNELKDRSLVEQIHQSLRSGSLSTDKLSPAQWSALVFILLSSEEDLDEFDLKKYSASEEALLKLLPVVKASKKAVLSGCNLSERSCEALSSVLTNQSSNLRELNLSNNDLGDSGVELLCAGLKSEQCTLETLRLSGCLITEKGCSSLSEALKSNPSHLRELDLSYNHPGDSGVKLLSAGRDDPLWKLDILKVVPMGVQWLTPGLRKYSCELSLDPNTVYKNIKLSNNNRTVTYVDEDQLHPDHPDRFDRCPQLLCTHGLTGRCYWEAEWKGRVSVSVTYGEIGRKGDSENCVFGENELSWRLICSDGGRYYVWHNNKRTSIFSLPSPSDPHRVAVFVDYPAGTLSFYRVSCDALIHLHTFNTRFTEPVYPGFGFGFLAGSSVSLFSPEK